MLSVKQFLPEEEYLLARAIGRLNFRSVFNIRHAEELLFFFFLLSRLELCVCR